MYIYCIYTLINVYTHMVYIHTQHTHNFKIIIILIHLFIYTVYFLNQWSRLICRCRKIFHYFSIEMIIDIVFLRTPLNVPLKPIWKTLFTFFLKILRGSHNWNCTNEFMSFCRALIEVQLGRKAVIAENISRTHVIITSSLTSFHSGLARLIGRRILPYLKTYPRYQRWPLAYL